MMAAITKLIVDCDTGVDDAVALLLAFQQQETLDVDILAITCVNGNCSVDEAVRNTLVTLKVAQKQVPVYRGCSKPLSTEEEPRTVVHGKDGLGGVSHEFTACEKSLHAGHAVTQLLELVNKYPGEITLLAMGPLTNIAMAYRLDEQFSSKLKKLVIMGGNSQGKGNERLAAEFNFKTDPEAAQIVIEETTCDCQILGWELCGLDSAVSWEWFDEWMASASSEIGKFVKMIVGTNFVAQRRQFRYKDGFSLCDPIAMAVTLNPDMVTRSVHHKVTVETAGKHTRGMLVIEWRAGLFPRSGTKPVEIVFEIDVERHKALLKSLMI